MRELGDRIDAMVSPQGRSELKRIRFDNNVTIKYKRKQKDLSACNRHLKKMSQEKIPKKINKSKAFINPIVM